MPRWWFRYSSFLFINISKIFFFRSPTLVTFPKPKELPPTRWLSNGGSPCYAYYSHKLMGAEGDLDNCFLPISQIMWESIAPPCPLWSEGQLDLLPQAHACTCIPGHIYCTHILMCVCGLTSFYRASVCGHDMIYPFSFPNCGNTKLFDWRDNHPILSGLW